MPEAKGPPIESFGKVNIVLKDGRIIRECEAWARGDEVRVRLGKIFMSLHRPQIERFEPLREQPAPASHPRAPWDDTTLSTSPAVKPPAAPLPASDQPGTLTLQVVDHATRLPLADARITAQVDFARSLAVTSLGRGSFRIGRPGGKYYFFLVARAGGHVAATALWDNRFGDDPIPEQFSFALHRGDRVGGLVVNEQGRPVPGARIHLQSARDNARDESDARFAWDHLDLVTGADGRWICEEYPRWCYQDDDTIVSHPDYAKWWNRIKTEELLAQTSRIVLQNGFAVPGVVTEQSGKPIAGAFVLLNQGGSLGDENKTMIARSDGEGRFRFGHAPPINQYYPHMVTVHAQGYAPVSQFIKSPPAAPLQFPLAPGQTVRFRVVDDRGRGIPGVRILPSHIEGRDRPWEIRAMTLGVMKNDRFEAETTTDQDGFFVSDSMPEFPVYYSLGLTGYQSQSVTLKPSRELTYTIKLAPYANVVGRVRDARTGEAIELFEVDDGRVYPFTLNSGGNIDYDAGPVFAGKNGVFHYQIRDAYPWRFNINAPGYKETESRIVRPDETTPTLDILLEPEK